MEVRLNHMYSSIELHGSFKSCPLCGGALSVSSSLGFKSSDLLSGVESLNCISCSLSLSFTFKMKTPEDNIEGYEFETISLPHLLWRRENIGLALYRDNAYVRGVPGDVFDLRELQKLTLLS